MRVNLLFPGLLAVLCSMWESIQGGMIFPSSTRQIRSTIANQNEMANYTFGFILENTLPVGGVIEVTFPTQFPLGLGFNTTNILSCSTPCTLVNRSISFSFASDLQAGISYEVSSYGVINPAQKGGTGHFWIKSLKGGQYIDTNLLFGVIGFAGDIGVIKTATVSLEPKGVQYAGQLSKYVFTFITSRDIPDNNFVRLFLPRGEFGVAQFPSCAAYPVGGVVIRGRLTCQYSGDDFIDVSGFKDSFLAGTSIGIVVTLKNPPYAHITNNFGIAVMRKFTQIMYDRKLDIPGVTITKSQFKNVYIEQTDPAINMTRNKIMEFRLHFTPTNILKAGSVIQLQFPASFRVYQETLLAQNVMFQVEFGLEDVSETNPLMINYDTVNDLMTIYNYKPKTVIDEIILRFWATTPDNPGESSPVVITSYTDGIFSNIIDQDSQFAKVTVNDVPSPEVFSIALSELYSGLGKQVIATFSFNPTISIPASGYISITFDPRLTVGEITAGSCMIYSIATASYVASPNCFKKNREIVIQLGSEQYTKGSVYSIQLVRMLFSPESSGTFFTDVTMFQPDFATRILSYTQRIAFFPAVFIFPSMSLYPNERFQSAVLDFSFITPFDIPASRPQNISTETVSFISIGFMPSGPTSLQVDLGYSSSFPTFIPCLEIEGLLPVDGNHINCTVKAFDSPSIILQNYHAIKAGTTLRFVVSSFNNPDGNFITKISIVKKFNRILSKIAEHSETFLVSSTVLPATFDKTLVAPEAFYTVNDTYAYHPFELKFNMLSSKTINGGENMVFQLPVYDSNFVMPDQAVQCTINELPYSCFSVPLDNTIVIQLTKFQSIPLASEIFIKFKPLRWPRINVNSAGPMLFRVTNTLDSTSAIYGYPQFLEVTPNLLLRGVLSIDKNRQYDIDVRYTFTFQIENEMPECSTVIISVPTYYNLITTTPAIRVNMPDFKVCKSATQLTTFFTSNKVQISNIAYIPARSTFRVILNGVSNPEYGEVMSGFNCQILYNDFTMVDHPSFFSISLEKAGSFSILSLQTLSIFPTNADVYATYTFTIQPRVKLSLGSQIEINFPSQYKVLPTVPDCSIGGALTTFASCTQSLSAIVFKMDTDYAIESGPIILKIYSVLNPDLGTTGSFEIFTTYDSVILERTDPANVTGRTTQITAKPTSISMVDTSFDPQNEGEISTYTFRFVPFKNIDINEEILFFFPKTFDQTLGNKLQCEALSGISDKISCTRLVDRVLHIDGISSYETSISRPITIQIKGIINPNRIENTIQPIGIGIKRIVDSTLIDYNSIAMTISSINAPGWCFFFSFNATNQDCRYTADYGMNFTASSSIPKFSSSGAVILDLPKQFNIANEIVSCTSFVSTYGTALNCEIENNRVWITGNTNDYSGNVVLTVNGVLNPIDKITSGNFIVSTYDGINQKVIERSYENLDPFYLDYNYPGPLIVVNNDTAITVMRGTQTDLIPIYVQDIAALNLTLVPKVSGPVSVIPFNIDIQIGQSVRYFRLSAPIDISLGNYTIDWTIQGELVPPVYTPIKTTRVIVITTGEMNVTIDSISNIPYGGTSMPVFFSIPKAPDIGFNILVNFKQLYPGLVLSTNSLSFGAGVTKQFLKIYYNDTKAGANQTLTSGALDLQVGGVNSNLYTMPFTSMVFNITVQDVIAPVINSVTINQISKNSVNFTITASEPCYVYYMVALAGTKTPAGSVLASFGVGTKSSASNTSNSQNSTSTNNTSSSNTSGNSSSQVTVDYYQSSTRAQFYQTFIFDSLTTSVLITGLNPQTTYGFYVVLQDRGSQFSTVQVVNFTTTDRDSAADVSVRLMQSYVSPYDAARFLRAIALILSLDPAKVIQSKYDFSAARGNTGSSRLLQAFSGTGLEKFNSGSGSQGDSVEEVSTLFSFNILSEIVSDVYPTPKQLGALLNNKTVQLAARIDNFDVTYSIPSSDFVRYSPSFVTVPSITNFTYQQVTITTRLDNYGWLYAVAIEKDNKDRSNAQPSTLQISMGLDSQNLPAPSGAVEISQTYEYFKLTVYNIKPSTSYALYVIGANAHPGYPDLMSSNFVKQLDFTSLPAPAVEWLDLSAGILSLSRVLYFVILVLISAGLA